jgi:fructan beta-fructosidase
MKMSNAHKAGFLIILALHVLTGTCAAQEIPISPFTKTNYGDWKATGTAFRKGPASGALLTQLEIENARDAAVICSEIDGDGPQGTLTSPTFTIDKPYIAFRIGGGHYEIHTCLNLLIDGKVVKSATGWNSDRLVAQSWDVRPWAGQQAQIQIVDEASGNWGHLNVAGLVQTDSPEQPPLVKAPLYQESLRPQFHFTARQWTTDRLNPGMRQDGWLNDLNGLIYHDGEYHLFAQRWNKCWIHAVSTNLIHWTELEPAFWEEQLDSGVQSGTCVVDTANSSGLGTDPRQPPMIAFWSRNDNRSHGISYSLDRGRTWRHHDKNPIFVHPERDPKVFWHAPTARWVMFLYGEQNGERLYHIFTSTNLLSWRDEKNPIKNSYECSDFFQLPIDGDTNRVKWVLVRADGKYSLGSFNGVEFKEETAQFESDSGPELLRHAIVGRRARWAANPDCVDAGRGLRGHALQPDGEFPVRALTAHHACRAASVSQAHPRNRAASSGHELVDQPRTGRQSNFAPGARRPTLPHHGRRGNFRRRKAGLQSARHSGDTNGHHSRVRPQTGERSGPD